jgi:hypothetical protein
VINMKLPQIWKVVKAALDVSTQITEKITLITSLGVVSGDNTKCRWNYWRFNRRVPLK